MRQGTVYYRDIPAGVLVKDEGGYTFRYDHSYFIDPSMPAVSAATSPIWPFAQGLTPQFPQGLTPLAAGRWHEIVLESDCRVFRLVLDGREDARVELPPLRVYGNLTVLLHGDWDDFVVE